MQLAAQDMWHDCLILAKGKAGSIYYSSTAVGRYSHLTGHEPPLLRNIEVLQW